MELLYGFPAGSSTGLLAVLEWLGRPYRLSRVDMLGEMREPSYARLNARHETPVLITDQGRALSETMAIAAHLEARDDERRISFDPRSRQADRMHQMMAFVNTGFTAAFTPLWAALEMAEPDPQQQAALRRFGRERVIERHDKLEAMLGDAPFLAGDRPTLADGVLIGVARWLEYHEVAARERWPRLDALRAHRGRAGGAIRLGDRAGRHAGGLRRLSRPGAAGRGDPPPRRLSRDGPAGESEARRRDASGFVPPESRVAIG